jgi:hypothetical protein
MASRATPSLRINTRGSPITTPAVSCLTNCVSEGSKASDMRPRRSITGVIAARRFQEQGPTLAWLGCV